MKAKELMVGDWVIYGKYKHKTLAIGYMMAELSQMKGSPIPNVLMADLKPVPLKAEMLEKNGWIPDSNWSRYGYFKDDEDCLFELTIDGGIYWTINYNEYSIKKLEYVHELQHAMRLCGLGQLADEFKV